MENTLKKPAGHLYIRCIYEPKIINRENLYQLEGKEIVQILDESLETRKLDLMPNPEATPTDILIKVDFFPSQQAN